MKLINYPAMASPQSIRVIEQNVTEYLPNGAKVIDPFCGTSRLLFSARMRGHHVTGVDCSPLAILTSRVCNQPTNMVKVAADKETILKNVCNEAAASYEDVTEEEAFWYPKSTFQALMSLLNAVDGFSSSANIRRFFWLVLVNVARSASYIREEEYKSHRIAKSKRATHSPNVVQLFEKNYELLARRVVSRDLTGAGGYRFFLGDVADQALQLDSFDAMICSPPYGDSISTVGYGQFARIPLFLLYRSHRFACEFPSSSHRGSIDSICLGGGKCTTSANTKMPEILSPVKKGPMHKFANDYFFRLDLLSRLLKKRSLVCLVLADRTYKGKKYPLIRATSDYMKTCGFSLLNRHDRYLTRKRLPRTMSKVEAFSSHSHEGMNYESVLIFRR